MYKILSCVVVDDVCMMYIFYIIVSMIHLHPVNAICSHLQIELPQNVDRAC